MKKVQALVGRRKITPFLTKIGYSRSLAAELGQFGIRVNCVAPGLVYPTDTSQQTSEEVKEMIIAYPSYEKLH
ncbi:MAG: SDR family oxidoreductase [Eubacteriales bacterium]